MSGRKLSVEGRTGNNWRLAPWKPERRADLVEGNGRGR